MNRVRLLPIVIMAAAALLLLKTTGLVTNGGYVLTGVSLAQAAGGGGGGESHGGAEPGETITLPDDPTIEDHTPTISEDAGHGGGAAEAGGHGAPAASSHDAPAEGGHDAPAEGDVAHGEGEAVAAEAGAHGEAPANSVEAENACALRPVGPEGEEPSADGQLTVLPADCPPLADAIPQQVTSDGVVPLSAGENTLTEQTLLDRMTARRTELEGYAQELTMRASLVEAAEKRMEERQQTLQAMEAQISSLVEERKEMEEGQFASIVAMYETMKPRDAATIFNALDMEVLLRVSKMMSPRKLAPIMAAMDTARAQELTVRMASTEADPLETMTPDDLAALPQIVGQ